VFSQLPAVFAFGLTQDALQIRQRPAAWLWASKAWGNPCMQLKQGLDPAADIGGGGDLYCECGMVGWRHLLLLSGSALGLAVSHLRSLTSGRRGWSFSPCCSASDRCVKKSATVVRKHRGLRII